MVNQGSRIFNVIYLQTSLLKIYLPDSSSSTPTPQCWHKKLCIYVISESIFYFYTSVLYTMFNIWISSNIRLIFTWYRCSRACILRYFSALFQWWVTLIILKSIYYQRGSINLDILLCALVFVVFEQHGLDCQS